jgi:hypothetical protein
MFNLAAKTDYVLNCSHMYICITQFLQGFYVCKVTVLSGEILAANTSADEVYFKKEYIQSKFKCILGRLWL